MRRVQVTVPAGAVVVPGCVGLALGLHNTVQMSLSGTNQPSVVVNVRGEGRGAYLATVQHPAMQGAAALFKHLDQPMPPIEATCLGEIPPESGLGDRAAWTVAGLFAANNLLETPLRRERIAELACEIVDSAAEAVTALLGGLTLVAETKPKPIYRRVEMTAAMRVGLVVPSLKPAAEQNTFTAVDISRAALLTEALRKGDLALAGQAAGSPALKGSELAVQAAGSGGASAILRCGAGPALIVLAKTGLDAILEAMRDAFAGSGATARTWVLHVDTQGVAITLQK